MSIPPCCSRTTRHAGPGTAQPELGFDVDPGFDLDQTPAYDLTEPEPDPGFDFDQSVGV